MYFTLTDFFMKVAIFSYGFKRKETPKEKKFPIVYSRVNILVLMFVAYIEIWIDLSRGLWLPILPKPLTLPRGKLTENPGTH